MLLSENLPSPRRPDRRGRAPRGDRRGRRDRRGRPPDRPRRQRVRRAGPDRRRACCGRLHALTDLAPLHQPKSLRGIDVVGRVLPEHAGGRLLRHRLPRANAGGGVDLRAAGGVAQALGSAPVRLPRPLARLGLAAGGRAGRAARSRSSGSSPATSAPARRCAAVDRGPFGRHDDGLHAARGAGDGDALGLGRPGPRPLARGARRDAALGARLDARAPLGPARPDRHRRHAGGARGRGRGRRRSRLAVEVYLHRLRGGIAAMAAAMDGLDAARLHRRASARALAAIRRAAAAGLAFLGVAIDPRRQRGAEPDAEIGASGRSGSLVRRPGARGSPDRARRPARPGGYRLARRAGRCVWPGAIARLLCGTGSSPGAATIRTRTSGTAAADGRPSPRIAYLAAVLAFHPHPRCQWSTASPVVPTPAVIESPSNRERPVDLQHAHTSACGNSRPLRLRRSGS